MEQRWNHLVNGTERPGSRYTHAYNPATGQPVSEVALGEEADVEAAVHAAQSALADWRDQKPIERGRVLLKIASELRLRREQFTEIEGSETGKPTAQLLREIETTARYFEFYGSLCDLYEGEVINLGPGYHSYTRREPFGVVAIITPWNAPVNQAARGVAPALASGNCVVVKPSEFTSGSTVALAELALECGVPAGVFNVVLGLGPDTGAALASNPGVRKIAFTGSVRAGREIGRIAADRIIPVTLELGGKSPNIVFEDADLPSAAAGAIRAFCANAGQICLAGTRLLVQRSVHDQFVEHLTNGLQKVKTGPEADARVGPLITEAQYQRVQNYIELAKQEGAYAAHGGSCVRQKSWGDGWYLTPTVFVNVTNDMRIAQEEIFGPVVVVIPFEDEADAIRIANDTDYGLAAGIWTENISRAHRVAAAIEAGQIYVNEYMAGGVETPLGGYKNSGHGREKGIEALHHYTQLKSVTIKLSEAT